MQYNKYFYNLSKSTKSKKKKETHFQLQVVRKFQFSEEMEKCNAPRFFASFNQCCRFLHAILDY